MSVVFYNKYHNRGIKLAICKKEICSPKKATGFSLLSKRDGLYS